MAGLGLWWTHATTFTTDTTIPVGEATYENLDLVVEGCRLRIEGDHAFGRVELRAAGRLIFAGTNLTASVMTARDTATIELEGGATVKIAELLSVAANSTMICKGRNQGGLVEGGWKGAGVTIEARAVEVDATSRITADSQGYACPGANESGNGPGGGRRGWWGGPNASGGGHGGLGGVGDRSGFANPAGTTHGSATGPTDLGSAGGGVDGIGASGGGAIRLAVAEALTLDGVISANGGSTTGWAAGGAGGSLWIATGLLSGAGSLQAHGGVGSGSGSGGGGRIAVYFATNQFTGLANCDVRGGTGDARGQEGTLAFFDTTVPQSHLQVFHRFALDPGSRHTFGAITVADAGQLVVGDQAALAVASLLLVTNGSTLTLGGGAHLQVVQAIEVSSTSTILAQSVNNTGRVGHVWAGQGGTIDAGSLRVDATSRLSADSQGYRASWDRPGAGPGGGVAGWWGQREAAGSSGGSYAGVGGKGRNNPASVSYGLAELPADLGSAGGTFESIPVGHGGGWLGLTIEEDLEIAGVVSANGGGGGSAGGGAGGGILISARRLAGAGRITADGGSATGIASGGGGGRIALYCWGGNLMPANHITAAGGTGFENGTEGSVVIRNQPYSRWTSPVHNLFHATESVGWSVVGVSARHHRARIEALRGAQTVQVGDQLPSSGAMNWDTTTVADGQYVLRLTLFEEGAGQVGELTRNVLVNNAVTWHGGAVAANETWPAGPVHVVSGQLRILADVTVTIAPGAVVKFDDAAELQIESGGALDAVGETGHLIVLTSLADDTAAGDTNLDADQTIGRRGEWTLRLDTGARFTRDESTEMRFARVTHAGPLATDETWSGLLLHLVTDDVTVVAGATLTIEAGAVVKFEQMKSLVVASGAQLVVAGTVAEPVVCTSSRDDLHGGDSNGDADETAPAPGDWRWILVEGGEAVIEHAVMVYGGGTPSGAYESAGILRVTGEATVTVTNSILRGAPFEAVKAEGGQTTLVGCVVADADRGVNVDGNSSVRLLHCTLDNHGTGIWGHGGSWEAVNSLISRSRVAGIDTHLSPSWTLRHCDVWSASGANFIGAGNPIGADGNLAVNPQLKQPDAGDYRLRHLSPVIDAAAGPAATLTDLMGAPRYDDPRMPNTGTATANGAFADLGAFEFVESAESSLDLVVREVTGPMAAEAGTWATLSWRVLNTGPGSYAGAWHDQVWFTPTSPGLGDEPRLAAEVVSHGNLGPSQDVAGTAVVRVPGGLEGAWRWQVRANVRGEVFEGRQWTNNTGEAAATTTLTVPELATGGTPLTRQFSAVGESHWFKVVAAEDAALVVALDLAAASGGGELYVREGSLPTPQDFDFRSLAWGVPDVEVAVPASATKTYYVLALARSLPEGSSSFSIGAAVPAFGLASVTPATIGDQGSVTLTVRGNQLSAEATYALVKGGEVARSSVSVTRTDTTLVTVQFGLSGLAGGVYDLQVVDQQRVATLPAAISVQAAGPVLWTSVSGRRIFRVGRPEPFQVHYGNSGLTDCPGGLLFISGVPDDAVVEVGPVFQPPLLPNGVTLPQPAFVRTEFGTGLMPVEVPRLAPGESGSVTLQITLPRTEGFSFERHVVLFPEVATAARGLDAGARTARRLSGSPLPAGTPVGDRAGLAEALEVAFAEYPTGYLPVRHAWRQSSDASAVHLLHQLISRARLAGSALRGWTLCPIGRGTDRMHVALALTSPGGRAYLLDNGYYPAVVPLVAVQANQWRLDPDWLLNPTNAGSLWGTIEGRFFAGNTDPWGIAGPMRGLGSSSQAGLARRRGVRLMAGAVTILNDDLFGPLDPQVPPGSWLANSAANMDLYIYLFNEQRPYHPGDKPPYESVGSEDPNVKHGPLGVGSPGWLAAGQDLHYTICFENLAAAGAPAQAVSVVDPMHPALDPATIELTGIGFNNTKVPLPRGRQHFAITVAVATDPHPVRVTADYDAAASQLTWTMRSVDPVTGGLPDDPFAGFLPPNRAGDAGLGYVSFRARLREDLPHGTAFTNVARIVFDVNPPILTPVCVNTLDLLPPTSTITALPSDSGPEFQLNWSGQDEGGGIVAYRVFVAQDGGPYLLWMQTTNTTARFQGDAQSRYAFYSVALDAAGHCEAPPAVPDTVTVVSILPPTITAVWIGDELELRWNAGVGLVYHVETASAFSDATDWQTVATVSATSTEASWKDPEPQPPRFYRVRMGD